MRKTGRWPYRSPRLPDARSAIVTAPRYRVTSDETVTASTSNWSMMLGRATASMVELSGTRIAPLAIPNIAGLSSRASRGPLTGGARSRWCRRSRPDARRRSASSRRPSRRPPAGANSRATTAACDSTPPVLVTSPPAIAKSGTHDGFDDGQTMMSPGWTAPKSSWVRVTRAGPRTTPAEAPVPRISSATVDS